MSTSNDLDDDDQERLIDAIEEGDPSDLIGQLLRNMRDQLLRAPIGLSLGNELAERDRSNLIYYNDREWEAQQAGRVDVILEMLARSRPDTSTPEVRARATELVAEGPQTWHEGVTLDVIWCGDVSDAAMTPEQADAGGRQLSFQDASVVLLDTSNGSRHDVEIPGALTTKVTDIPAHLDSFRGQDGYGWDDTAGVVHSVYLPGNITSEWVRGTPAAARSYSRDARPAPARPRASNSCASGAPDRREAPIKESKAAAAGGTAALECHDRRQCRVNDPDRQWTVDPFERMPERSYIRRSDARARPGRRPRTGRSR